MTHQVIAPPPLLRNHVRYLWTLESRTNETAKKTFTVMCNGEPGLIFQQNPQIFSGFEGESLPQLFVFGQATKYGQLTGGGTFRTLGITFRPTGLKSIFGLDASELTDENICISKLGNTNLGEQLLNCSTVQQQADCLFSFLLEKIRHHEACNKKINYAVNSLQQGKKLAGVLHDLNLSERSLERFFLADVGITPVLYARICRFQSSLALFRQGKFRSLTEIAYSLGYFDQSHFIRDFKQFSGASPGTYLRKTIERMPGFPEWQL